jgi:hypothetical protein
MNSTAGISMPETADAQPSIEERHALIERVAASPQFGRSARLRDFLLYVGGQSLKDGCPEINEQEIGMHVFGRPKSYDRSQDNIVRVNATELRKRIELYFATDGAQEPLILEIPRGGYKPIFHRRLAEAPAQHVPEHPALLPRDIAHTLRPAEAEQSKVQSSGVKSARNRTYLLAAASVILAIACAVLFLQNRKMRSELYPWGGKPAVAAFWEAFLRYHQQTDIVLPDDSFSVIQDLINRPVSLEDYLNRNYMRQIQSSNMSADRKIDVDQVFDHNLVTFGGIRAAEQILASIPASYAPRLMLSRYYVADAITHNNIILVGGKKANPWVQLFDDQLNFITDYDHNDEHPHAFVSNRHPRPGELAVYAAPAYQNTLVGYSVVAYLPNPSRTGNVIILAGTDSDATTAAANFLTSEDQLDMLRNTLHVQQFPYFEVLLRTIHLSGTSLNSSLIAYRAYPGLH